MQCLLSHSCNCVQWVLREFKTQRGHVRESPLFSEIKALQLCNLYSPTLAPVNTECRERMRMREHMFWATCWHSLTVIKAGTAQFQREREELEKIHASTLTCTHWVRTPSLLSACTACMLSPYKDGVALTKLDQSKAALTLSLPFLAASYALTRAEWRQRSSCKANGKWAATATAT